MCIRDSVYDAIRNNEDPRPCGGATLYVTHGLGGPENFDHGMCDVAFSAWGGINLSVDEDSTNPDSQTVWDRRRQGISSRHSGGLNAARGDGSVSFLRETIDTFYGLDATADDVPLPVNGLLPYRAFEKACAVADGLAPEDF